MSKIGLNEWSGIYCGEICQWSQGGGCLEFWDRDTQDKSCIRPCGHLDCLSSYLTNDKLYEFTHLSFELNATIRMDHQWCQTSVLLQFFKDSIALNCFVTQLAKKKEKKTWFVFCDLLYIFSITIHRLCWLSLIHMAKTKPYSKIKSHCEFW